MGQFFEELKRRNVLRVAIAYLAVSWLLIQVVETLFPIFGLSDALIRLVVILLIIGFPLILIFSWIYELTPEGLKRERDVDRSSSVVHRTDKKLDRAIIVVLTLALGYFAFDKFVLEPARDAELQELAKQRGRNEALTESFGDNSIAVLPFANMSSDPDQAYFSDGISDDILSLLSKTGNLRVISRSSSFALRHEDLSTSEIARRLNVSFVLEGSVRKAGEEVRVSAQLIKAGFDSQVWAESYDRQLDDIFAIQDEIAVAVVRAIRPMLLGESIQSRQAPDNPNSYVQYLKARHVYLKGRERRDVPLVRQSMNLFDSVLATDPDYAPAYAGLSDAWGNLAILGAVSSTEGYAQSRRLARQALSLDESLADAWLALADIQLEYDWDLRAAGDSYHRALRLDPQNADGLRSYAFYLIMSDQTDEGISTYRDSISLDPLSLRAYIGLSYALMMSGDYVAADQALQDVLALNPAFDAAPLHRWALIQQGRISEVADLMPAVSSSPWDFWAEAIIYHDKGEVAKADKSIARLIEMDAVPLRTIAGYYALTNDFDMALEYLNKAVDQREINLAEVLISPDLLELRKDARFWEVLDRAGIEPPAR